MASLYSKLIVEFTGCTPEEAPKVEQYMRDTYHTLDHLTRAAFKKEAKICLLTVRAEAAGATECSICRRVHGREVIHACE